MFELVGFYFNLLLLYVLAIFSPPVLCLLEMPERNPAPYKCEAVKIDFRYTIC